MSMRSTHHRRNIHVRRLGFTLVEMLVSVAIVLLMMTMFSQIFVLATNSLSQQRGIAENDQRGRMLTAILRSDLDRRTMRDVFPFLSGDDTSQLGHSLSRRSGYLEIDEGIPSDDTDDVLSFTCSVNIRLQSSESSPFSGRAQTLSAIRIKNLTANAIVLGGDNQSLISLASPLWIAGSLSPSGNTNNGRFFPTSVDPPNGDTTINFPPNTFSVAAYDASAVAPWGYLCLSEAEPEFDDGTFGNDTGASAFAEVCYFLRNGVLYRRVLLIRDTRIGGDGQPTWSTGAPLLWNNLAQNENYPTSGTSTFWRDFDYSAFYFNGKIPTGGGSPQAPGVHFHNANESLSNSSVSPLLITDETSQTAFPISLGIPHFRFGHNSSLSSSTAGLPQDSSSVASLPGPDGIYGNADDVPVSIGRFNLQECSNSSFGYPGYIPNAGNPFNRTDLQVDPTTGLVTQYSGQTFRRGEDILLSNVLSFDVKVFDPNINQFVDLGDDTVPKAPSASAPTYGTNSAGRLNRTYGPDNHFRFDTWHPSASVGSNPNDAQPPYLILDAVSGLPIPLASIQITIDYRDPSTNQIRQTTIMHSLVDRAKQVVITNEAPEE